MISAPLLQVLFGFYSMNSIEVVLWLAMGAILIEIERQDDGRWWLAFGALAGLGLLTKHTVTTFAAGLGLALLLTPARRHLRSPWLWADGALAVLMAVPHVVWQQADGWPSIEFYRNAALYNWPPHGAWCASGCRSGSSGDRR